MKEYNLEYWEDVYEMPVDDLPWEIKEAPAELREYIENNRIDGGKALDSGCGTGNFSMYLAQNGFDVVGVDYSEKAIVIAEAKNKADMPVRYICADIMKLSDTVPGEYFDLMLDYKVAHHMPDDKLAVYISQCMDVLKPGGRILLVAYSDKDDDAAGKKAVAGKFGNVMFYRSADDIREFYKSFKEISYKEVMLGKKLNHAGHCFVFEKPKTLH